MGSEMSWIKGGFGAFLAVLVSLAVYADPAIVLRSIDSASMEPTIPKGSQVQVNPDAYLQDGPKRWDIVVYKRPLHEALLTHRIVGLPGERLTYTRDKQLLIEGVPVPSDAVPPQTGPKMPSKFTTFAEALGADLHFVQVDPKSPPVMAVGVSPQVSHSDCQFSEEGFDCRIPFDHYYLMGDNRDWALDSRYVGFIHRLDIVARVERWLSDDRREYRLENGSLGVK